jgi:hypothetical protein
MYRCKLVILGVACMAGVASAQLPSAVSSGLSAMQSGFPNVGTISTENAAGLLSYCLKNDLIAPAGASSVMGNLMEKPNIGMSSGYALGEQGKIISANRAPMTFSDIPPNLKGQACEAVLKRGSALLGQKR